jgi:hypothetical protein
LLTGIRKVSTIAIIPQGTSFAQNVEFLTPDFVNDGGTRIRIRVTPSIAAVLEVTRDGGTSWGAMKENAALIAGADYIFEPGSDPGDSINFRSPDPGGITLTYFSAELFFEG